MKNWQVRTERIADIASDCRVMKSPLFYLPETADAIDISRFPYETDVMDSAAAKICPVEKAREALFRIKGFFKTKAKENEEKSF